MDNTEVWKKVLTDLELNISRASYITWVQNTSLISKENGVAVVNVPSAFSKEWLENKFNKLILKFLRDACSEIKEVRYEVSSVKNPIIPSIILKKKRDHDEPVISQFQEKFLELTIDPKTNLNPRYTIDSYVVGGSNELAYATSQAIIKNPGKTYNPLFIYGGVGLGKTHLIQAIGNEIKKSQPNMDMLYIPSERFTADVINGIRDKTIDKLKNEYLKKDLLIIDDIQFISGKEKTQEQFFHIFNFLYDRNKQIIISSDRQPKALPLLEERLRSRFEGGMITDISAPDFEMRMVILKNKAQEKKMNLPEEVFSFLAMNIQKNIRELEGALNIIQAKFCDQSDINLNQIKKSFNDLIKSPKKAITLKQVIKAVCEFYDIEDDTLLQKNRRKEVSMARQIIMYFLREELRYSYPYIGQKLGGRDHTTAIHAYKKIKREIENDVNLEEEINLIKQKIYS